MKMAEIIISRQDAYRVFFNTSLRELLM